MQGHSCQSLVVDIVEFVLSASEVDSVTLDEESEVELGEEHELCGEGHVMGVLGVCWCCLLLRTVGSFLRK